jgi:hypothetical protein
MKDFLTFGLVVCFLLVCFGCAHTSDSPASMPRQQEIAPAQTNATPPPSQEVPIAEGAPRVQVSETYFDFGIVAEGNNYLHSFQIRNVGKGDLVIKKIIPGCGSAVAAFDRTIPPGGEGKVTIRLWALSCRRDTKKEALVFTNDPQTPYFKVAVEGRDH